MSYFDCVMHFFSPLGSSMASGPGEVLRPRLKWKFCNQTVTSTPWMIINVLRFFLLALLCSYRYVLASTLTRRIPLHPLYLINKVIWSPVLIRDTACGRWCCMPPLILQLSLYSQVVKSVQVALSSRKFRNMSNGVRGDNVSRAGSKSQFCSSPLILWFT